MSLRLKILSVDEINSIADDYNNLWRGNAITDKDHGQVEDLIESNLAAIHFIEALENQLKRLTEIEAALRDIQRETTFIFSADVFDWLESATGYIGVEEE